ncbi:MAG: hypothetical protein J1E03_01600 [Acetatifactor sp.]|nr:hypothetical protein [Acetatifactor sp.]
MPIKTSRQETINALNAIFEKHKNERVCVLATTCCGKTTLLRQIPGCVDLDDELWPQLTAEEAGYISQKPWTKEIGDYIDKLVYERITIKSGHPLFSTIIVDCDVVVYLDISDELLAEHCEKRGNNFMDAKNVKEALEQDWNSHREEGGKTFYYLVLTE